MLKKSGPKNIVGKKKSHVPILKKKASSLRDQPGSGIRKGGKYSAIEFEDGILDTQEQVANNFNVSVRTVRNWIDQGMPVRGDCKYDLPAIQAWHSLRNNWKKGKNKSSDDWAERYREAKARLAELDLRKRLGEVIEIADVQKQLIKISLSAKATLLLLPNQLPPRLIGLTKEVEMQKVLMDAVKQVVILFQTGEFFGPCNLKINDEQLAQAKQITTPGPEETNDTPQSDQG